MAVPRHDLNCPMHLGETVLYEETRRMMQQRYPGMKIPEFHQYCYAPAKMEEQVFED